MSVRTETRSVRGVELTCTQFPARRALAMMERVAKFERGLLSGGELESWPQQLLACCTALVDGKQIPLNSGEMIDAVFSGRLPALADAMAFAIEVNYGDFSDGAPGLDGARPSQGSGS